MKPHFVTFDRNPSFLFVAGSPDILICGNCREMFTDLVDMIDHKKYYCKLRFTCKCDMTQDGVDCINGAQCGGGFGEGKGLCTLRANALARKCEMYDFYSFGILFCLVINLCYTSFGISERALLVRSEQNICVSVLWALEIPQYL